MMSSLIGGQCRGQGDCKIVTWAQGLKSPKCDDVIYGWPFGHVTMIWSCNY